MVWGGEQGGVKRSFNLFSKAARLDNDHTLTFIRLHEALMQLLTVGLGLAWMCGLVLVSLVL